MKAQGLARRARGTLAALVALSAAALGPPGASAEVPYPGTPNPGGSETIDLPVPPPAGKYFGFIDNSAGADWQLISQADYADMSTPAGANAIRLNLDWRYLERTRDVWSEPTWQSFEVAYDKLLERGITPILNIGFAPTWARELGTPQNCYASDCRYAPARFANGQWAEFAAEVARRFPAGVVEVWNEPNIPQFWRSGPDPQRFAEVLNIAHDAIKAVRPSMRVLAGGVNNNQTRGGGLTGPYAIPLRDFLDQAYAATPSIKHNMDALSIHTTSQELAYGSGSLLAKVFEDVRTVKDKYNDSKRRLWVTEAGLSTTGPQPRTLREQADGLLRQYRRFLSMKDVDAVLINALVELSAVPATNLNRGYGLRFHNPGYPVKPAYCAFSNRVSRPLVEGCSPMAEPIIPPGSGDGEIDPAVLPGGDGNTGGTSGGTGNTGGTSGGTDVGQQLSARCVRKISRLKGRRDSLRARKAVYLPYARAGHKPSKRAVRRIRRRLTRVRHKLRTARRDCRMPTSARAY